MKSLNAKQKVNKKMLHKRKVSSTPNMPVKEMGVKTADMFMVSPEEIRKYKKEIDVKIAEAKTEKAKTVKKTKHLNKKEADKIVMEPHKLDSEEKKNTEEYQWLIKKHIVNVLGSDKKKALEKDVAKKTGTKSKIKMNKVIPPKIKSSVVKDTQYSQNLPPASKSEQKPKKKGVNQEVKRAKTANLPIRERQRQQTAIIHQSEYLTPSKNNPALILHPDIGSSKKVGDKKSSLKKLRNLFDIFKSQEETVETKRRGDKKLDLVMPNSLYAELKQAEEKNTPKKGAKIAKSTMNDESSTIHLEKPKTKKIKDVTEVDAPNKEKKKKRKLLTQKSAQHMNEIK